MRIFYLLLAASISFTACQNNETGRGQVASNAAGGLTTIEWLDSSKNLGKISQGQKLQIAFRFRNSGKNPLVIESVRPSCGCTVAEYPKEPIQPGQEAQITGSFDSNGREGLQHKEISVTANTEGSTEHKLIFEVDIQAPPAATEPK